MDTNNIAKQMKLKFILTLAAGLLLLAGGLAVQALGIHLMENNKAIVSLSFIPLALAAYYGLTAALMHRNPKYMRSIVTEQADERIAAMKQRADSITLHTMLWVLRLGFLGYTFAFPTEIFVSAGWWITFVFFFMAHTVQGVVLAYLMGKDK